MIRPVRPDAMGYIRWLAGAAIKKGQICYLSSGEAKPTAEGVSTAVILGVAVEDCADAATVKLYNPRQQFEAEFYQGGSTDTFAAADVGKAFDIYVDGTTGEMYIDPNDTTGAMAVVYSYNNDKQTAIVRFLSALIYLA